MDRVTLRPQPPDPHPASLGGRAGADRISAFLEELARAPEVEPGTHTPGYESGQVVGRFHLQKVIGRGGFGVVFEAFDAELQRTVAFKAIRPGRGGKRAAQADWLRLEAIAAARLAHPGIVTLHDVGMAAVGPYLVLERLHGETLQDRLGRGPCRRARRSASRWRSPAALGHAHEAGVIHRDLSRPTSSSPTSGTRRCSTSGSPRSSGRATGPEAGPRPTWRPSSGAPRRRTPGPTSIHWA